MRRTLHLVFQSVSEFKIGSCLNKNPRKIQFDDKDIIIMKVKENEQIK